MRTKKAKTDLLFHFSAQLGDVKLEDLSGLEALLKPGKKGYWVWRMLYYAARKFIKEIV